MPSSLRSRIRFRRECLAGFAALALALGACGARTPLTAAPNPQTATGSRVTKPRLVVGVTHTQYSLDSWGNTGAVTRGEALLRAHPGTFQNQHLMGWGAGNPEPRRGSFDWADLDRRIALVRRTSGTPVITLCCAPDWMKGGAPGRTDWSRLDVAPARGHYADFADLARRVAQRYPDVHYFQVWNEMKGFFDAAKNRWRYEEYTNLYNEVYDALKRVNRHIKVGGPYVVMESCKRSRCSHPSEVSGPWGVLDRRPLDVIAYWLAHAHGADFVAVDGGTRAKGAGFLTTPYAATAKYRAVNEWIRARTALPIWWSELSAVPYGNTGYWSQHEQARVTAKAIRVAQASGATVVLLWEPEGHGGWPGLWSRTRDPSGGRASAVYRAVAPWLGRRHCVNACERVAEMLDPSRSVR